MVDQHSCACSASQSEPAQRAAVWMSQAQNSVVEGEQKPAVHFNVGGQLVSQLGQDVGTLAPDPVPAMPREQGDEASRSD
jgi:hypothetical protein